jgi:hypothetical protein
MLNRGKEASFFGETLNAALPFFVLELSFFTSFALPHFVYIG